MYTEKVMDHFQHPRNVGELENASGVGTVGNAKCGDITVSFFLQFISGNLVHESDASSFLLHIDYYALASLFDTSIEI